MPRLILTSQPLSDSFEVISPSLLLYYINKRIIISDLRIKRIRRTLSLSMVNSQFPKIFLFVTNDQSIASTKTKYIKLNTKTQNIFCRSNENLTTFLYTLTGATRKQKEKKNSLLKYIQKSNVIKKKFGF